MLLKRTLLRRVRNKHCQRVLAWEAHLDRPRNCDSWASLLQGYRGEAWLEEQRLLHSRTGESRTRTRAIRYVATRWHDGVAYAKAHLRE